MKTVTEILPAGQNYTGEIIGTVTLDFDNRRRRRIRLTMDGGEDFLLNLAKVQTLRDGDILLLPDGAGIEVKAAPEAVVDVYCKDTAALIRVAWHLGNRHLPTQLMGEKIRIRQDHVIEEMLVILGAKPVRLMAPFDPEGGAYGHGETESHSHEHDHPHSHGHGSDALKSERG
ncbi:urease accessory protein UreE [Sneathiella glossodoripedis]|uniref:urease accessory protein UreE n=1 Tax=Sneathiella glossodoripedis TaxID=418853 RepID=UPI00046EF109|nr:urease accessory protein UreE [Sneathiella glossodoripedis]